MPSKTLKQKYNELLTDPKVDVDVTPLKHGRKVDPRVVEKLHRLMDIEERSNKLSDLQHVSTWIEDLKLHIYNEINGVQLSLSQPELRKSGESAEFLAGKMKGLMVTLSKIKADEGQLKELEDAKLHGLIE